MTSCGPSDLVPIADLPENLAETVGLIEPPPQPNESQSVVLATGSRPAVSVGDDVNDFIADLLYQYLARAGTDGRNNTLFDYLCQLRDNGVHRSQAAIATEEFVDQVAPTNPSGDTEPFTMSEALATLDSVYGRPAREPWPNRARTSRPTIQVNNRQLRDLSGAVHAALAHAAGELELYRQGNTLVQVRDDDDGNPIVVQLDRQRLRRLATETANFIRVEGEGEDLKVTNVAPPMHAIDDVLAEGNWDDIPTVVGITESPVVRPDASILTEPGYDPHTRLLYVPAPGLVIPPVPDDPSEEQIRAARDRLLDLFEDFPFDGASSLANAVGLLITAVARPLIAGLVPLFLITAPQRGSGKTLIVKLIGLIATGRLSAAMAWPRLEEEVEKRVLAKLRTGDPMLLIDNLHTGGALKSPALDALLTTDMWEGRVLGRSEMLKVPNRLVIAATGNNLEIGGDLARRCVPIRLDAKTARPELRQFHRPEIESWALDERCELLAAVFTLVRAWESAGRPVPSSGVRLASYQPLVDTVGGILEVAGIEGFLDNRDQIADTTDEETQEWATFLDALRRVIQNRAHTVAELREVVDRPSLTAVMPRELAESLADARSIGSWGSRLGHQFASRRDRRFAENGLRIEDAGKDPSTKAVRWRVVTDDD